MSEENGWRWKAQRGTWPHIDAAAPTPDVDDAYRTAELWYAQGHRVSILLQSPTNGSSWCLADSREVGENWVCGLERWRRNEARS